MNKNRNAVLTPNAQLLRRQMTKEERRLWYEFFRLQPFTVKRQKVIGRYIVDFCIPSSMLIVELDGSQHYSMEGMHNDAQRDSFLQSQGYRVLRYTNLDINRNFSGVCEDILHHMQSKTTL